MDQRKTREREYGKEQGTGELDCSPLCGALITPLMSETGVVCLHSAPNEGIREQRRTSPILTSPLKKMKRQARANEKERANSQLSGPINPLAALPFASQRGKS